MQAHRSHLMTALAVLSAVGLADATVFAQGVSPWLNAVDVLQDALYRAARARAVAHQHRHRRADVRLR